jgi:hypothetical protein
MHQLFELLESYILLGGEEFVFNASQNIASVLVEMLCNIIISYFLSYWIDSNH